MHILVCTASLVRILNPDNFDTLRQAKVSSFAGSAAMCVAYAPHGKHFVAGVEYGTVLLMDPYALTVVGRMHCPLSWLGERDYLLNIAYEPTGERFVIDDTENVLHIFGVGQIWSELHSPRAQPMRAFAYSPSYTNCSSLADAWASGSDAGRSPNVIQVVDYEDAAVTKLSQAEATQVAQQLWASGIENLIAHGEGEHGIGVRTSRLVLLTFSRATAMLQSGLLASSVAVAAEARGISVQPAWAHGGTILAEHVDADALAAAMPLGKSIRPWHVVLREEDEEVRTAVL